MASFSTEMGFKRWLNELPEVEQLSFAPVLALRTALRMLPLASDWFRREIKDWSRARLAQEIILPQFRVLSSVAALTFVPTAAEELGLSIIVADSAYTARGSTAAAYAAARRSSAFAASASSSAAACSSADAAAAYTARRSAYAAAVTAADAIRAVEAIAHAFADANAENSPDMTYSAAYGAARASFDPTAAVWKALSNDATALENGLSSETLAASRLWPERTPDWAELALNDLSRALLALDQSWEVWLRWYRARLTGAPVDAVLEVRRAKIEVTDWKQGSAHVNALILAIEAERARELAAENKLPEVQRLFVQSKLGVEFTTLGAVLIISSKAAPHDLEAAKLPLVVQLHAGVRDRARLFRDSTNRIGNLHGWEKLPQAAARFAAVIDQDLVIVAEQIATAWECTVELGTFLEHNQRISTDKRTNLPCLPLDVFRELESLVRVAAPWIRRFPTAREIDDEAGAFLAREELFAVANSLFDAASRHTLISDEDRALLKDLLDAMNRGAFQGQKAGSRLVSSARNFISILAASMISFQLGTIGNNAAPESVIAIKGAEMYLDAEAYIIELAEHAPADLRAAYRSLLDGLKKSHGKLPIDPQYIVLPPRRPEED